MTHAVLFDIDGTLLRAGGAGREALARGAADALGVTLEAARAAASAMDFRGRIDPLLIDELTRRLGFDPGARDHDVQRAYLAALPHTLAGSTVELLPGVPELLATLEARGAVSVGLLTGNVRDGARLKLGAVGLAHLVERTGGFGEDGLSRGEVAASAVAALARQGVPAERVVVIGDTEHDVSAARYAGARAVAVATGWTRPEVLRAARPDVYVDDLTDPAPVLGLLG